MIIIFFSVSLRVMFILQYEFMIMIYLIMTIFFRLADFNTINYCRRFIRFNLDIINFWMRIIILVRIRLRLRASINVNSLSLSLIINIITFVRLLIILTKSILLIYLFFEVSIIPILIIILGWGGQPERNSAGIALLFYTAFCSIPLMVILINTIYLFGSLDWWWLCIYPSRIKNNFYIITLVLIVAFLVKLPIFTGHIWLPKAHVEAPVFGSIILAAVMLKLGGFGLIRLLPLRQGITLNLFISIRLIGILFTGLICVSLIDLKIIVAYSSVGHIALVIITLLTVSLIGLKSSNLIIARHAFCSSIIFFGVTKIYTSSSSRSMLINQGNLFLIPKFRILWIFTIIASIATPPLVRFFREVLNLILIGNVYTCGYIFIAFSVFIAGVYSLLIYTRSQHSHPNYFFLKFNNYRSLDYFISINHVITFLLFIFLFVIIM